MDFGKGTSFNASVDPPLPGPVNEIEHTYSNRGLWLGLAQTIPVTERISFMATGWYLIPSNSPSRERYLPLAGQTTNQGGLGERTWSTQNTWWYVDGALIFGSGLGCGSAGGINGLGLVLGARYDYFTTKFKDPYNNFGLVANAGDADVISYGVIPLLGAQYSLSSATTNLVFRIVGVPTLVGSAVYRETVLPGTRLDATGSYNGGHFLEAFAEYGQKIAGPAGIGIWGRWNTANGTSDLNVDVGGGINANTTMKLGLHRSSWSFGGSFNLDFNLPSL
jgi:hypothetical protein